VVKDKKPEPVVLKATNRAIENLLGVGLYFMGQDDCVVRISTGSLGVVDDIVDREGVADGEEEVGEEEEVPESRVRKCSVVEVAITLK
jgi:ribonuclease P/MRP protein subunit POP7